MLHTTDGRWKRWKRKKKMEATTKTIHQVMLFVFPDAFNHCACAAGLDKTL